MSPSVPVALRLAPQRALVAPVVVADALPRPVIVVGCGPVGVRFACELRRRAPHRPIKLLGAEETSPYNRVRLTSVVSGEAPWATLTDHVDTPDDEATEVMLGYRVVAIDREGRMVRDAFGHLHAYDHLVLATGSTPHVPEIEGMRLPGVFTFRDFADAQKLLARRVRSRHTVVVGGGLLGLEAARAMHRHGTEVTVIEHVDRLMPQQLDREAAAIVRTEIERRGMRVLLDDGVKRVEGSNAVERLQLRSGRTIECDTIVVAAGIRPNVGLARDAGLAVGRGIRVDDRLRTADPLIFAVGECAEHRDRVHGLVAPGYEQAAVAAHVIAGHEALYTGSIAAARLKVVGCHVFSIGEAATESTPDLAHVHAFRGSRHGVYRKIVTRRGRMIGALAVGPWPEISRIQEAVLRNRRVWPWTLLRFRRLGRLAAAVEPPGVALWPAHAVVCNCTGVTRGQLGEAIASGACTAAAACTATGASSVCGSCRPLVQELVGAGSPRAAMPGATWLAGLALAGVAGALALTVLPGLPYSLTADVMVPWDQLWRHGTAKQASGYTLLGLMAALAVLSLRKRIRRFSWLPFAGWRFFHVAVGLLAALAIVVHTGGRVGANLVFALAGLATIALATGGALGALIAIDHRIDAAQSIRWRKRLTWSHVLVLWPLPVLLGFHIVQAYFF
jgi:nitrite reductase (NADH) large subunit